MPAKGRGRSDLHLQEHCSPTTVEMSTVFAVAEHTYLKQATRLTCPRHQWLTTIPTPKYALPARVLVHSTPSIRPAQQREESHAMEDSTPCLYWCICMHKSPVLAFSIMLIRLMGVYLYHFNFLHGCMPHMTVPVSQYILSPQHFIPPGKIN